MEANLISASEWTAVTSEVNNVNLANLGLTAMKVDKEGVYKLDLLPLKEGEKERRLVLRNQAQHNKFYSITRRQLAGLRVDQGLKARIPWAHLWRGTANAGFLQELTLADPTCLPDLQFVVTDQLEIMNRQASGAMVPLYSPECYEGFLKYNEAVLALPGDSKSTDAKVREAYWNARNKLRDILHRTPLVESMLSEERKETIPVFTVSK